MNKQRKLNSKQKIENKSAPLLNGFIERLQEAPLSAHGLPIQALIFRIMATWPVRARSAALISVIDVSLSINEGVLLAERDTEK